jgi:hypothetical protein
MKDSVTEEFIEALTSTDIWKKVNKCDPLNEAMDKKNPKPWEGLGEGIETIIEFVEALKGKLISEAVNEESVNEINEILGTIESFLKKFCDS